MFAATLFVESYDRIMPELNKLLRSDNYVTRRQTLKLLVGIMADPLNAEMKSRYLTSSDNLKVVMNLMRDQSRTISSEAFRVFRVHNQIVPCDFSFIYHARIFSKIH